VTQQCSNACDQYHRLQAQIATPADELCACAQVAAIMLCHALSPNPIRCMVCNKELAPKRLDLSAAWIDEIADWNGVYGSVYRLWLDSREYEVWAKSELAAADSPINLRGLACCNRLGTRWPTYLWWFVEYAEEQVACPRCAQQLSARSGWQVCEPCKILVPNEAKFSRLLSK
jgi:hypothetical protein